MAVDEADLAGDRRPCETVDERLSPVVPHHNGRQLAVPPHIVPSVIDVDTRETVTVEVQRTEMLALEVDMSGGI
jgi:hypothetical protein